MWTPPLFMSRWCACRQMPRRLLIRPVVKLYSHCWVESPGMHSHMCTSLPSVLGAGDARQKP